MSKGCDSLLSIVQEIFPNQKVVLEHNIAKSGALFLDIYLPQLSLAFEFDGAQHFAYSEHFHGTPEAFRSYRKRDALKSDRCKELGIALIRVRFDERMDKDLVLDKINKALDDKDNNG
jgi:very-short-patch-repair endonuclease